MPGSAERQEGEQQVEQALQLLPVSG